MANCDSLPVDVTMAIPTSNASLPDGRAKAASSRTPSLRELPTTDLAATLDCDFAVARLKVDPFSDVPWA